jgi:hypothetical protein
VDLHSKGPPLSGAAMPYESDAARSGIAARSNEKENEMQELQTLPRILPDVLLKKVECVGPSNPSAQIQSSSTNS